MVLESGIHRFGMESGIQKVGIRNPMGWNPESRCWDPESRLWDPESRTFVDSLTWGEAFTHTRYSLAGDTPEALGLDALNTWQSGVFHAWSHPTQGMFALKAL